MSGRLVYSHNKIEIPEPFVNTYYLIKCARIALETSKIIGIDADNEYLNKVIRDCTEALYDAYYSPRQAASLRAFRALTPLLMI